MAVAVEVRGRGCGRLPLQVLPDASGDSLDTFVAATVASGAIVHTDGWAGYQGLRALGFEPPKQRARHPDHQFVLPRAHRAISNLKTWLQGTHRGVSPEHLPVYLDALVRHEALSDRAGCETPPLGCRSSLAKLRAA